jgi:selenocysteine lyase/cysteine desulfurase
MSAVDWKAVRSEFPSLANRTYLNTASFGQLPARAVAAAQRHFAHREQTAAIDFLNWFEDLEPIRASIAGLIHSQPDDIAFVPNAAYALSLAVSAVDWQPGDEILTLHDEFPNQLYAHAGARSAQGVECDWDQLEAHITERTKLFAVSTVNYTTGLRPNLSKVVSSLRRRGIVVYLDGTQSVGALQFDCTAIQPDFLAVDAYKWLISPNGAAFVYIHPEMRKRLPPNVIGWRSDKDWRNVKNLHHGTPRFGESAEKYEPGMLPFACLYALQASLKLVEEIGIGNIEQRVLGLADQLRHELRQLGAAFHKCKGESLTSQIVTACLPGVDSGSLAGKLAEQGISISARRVYLRISPHFYNNEEDVDRLVFAIRQLI